MFKVLARLVLPAFGKLNGDGSIPDVSGKQESENLKVLGRCLPCAKILP